MAYTKRKAEKPNTFTKVKEGVVILMLVLMLMVLLMFIL